jgi:thioredoxin-dependent peroxiredoxin
MQLNPGDAAPDFTVSDHTGKRVSLADLRGKPTVLWFFPEADTPGCTIEGCSFRDLNADFKKKGAAIYGVSFDPPAKNQAFVEKYHFNFPLLSDTERQMGLAYGACDSATDSSARRIGVVIDAEGKIKEWLPKVSAKSYPTEVLARL